MKSLLGCLLGMVFFGAGAAAAADMTVLRYLDQDPGDPPYLTRILVTPDFMRMDSGGDDGDFVLLDRRQRQVTNVMRGNKLAMVFSPGPLPPKPAKWKATLTTRQAAAGTQRFRLSVKQVVCSEGVAAGRAAAGGARAVGGLKALLAATQKRGWED
ncbi:MAG: hypothetical protein K0M66_11295 [Thiobacillus sp.]|nr:hypothetical protein [Thiobacillus sp.]